METAMRHRLEDKLAEREAELADLTARHESLTQDHDNLTQEHRELIESSERRHLELVARFERDRRGRACLERVLGERVRWLEVELERSQRKLKEDTEVSDG